MKTIFSNQINTKNKLNIIFILSISTAFLLRLLLAATTTGFDTDIACFAAWASRVYEGGFAAFYSPDVFTDYPPGYIYMLYPIGALLHHLQIDVFSCLGLILLKMPSILCDMIAGILIYYIGCKQTHRRIAIVISMLYLLNPAVLINSSVWGQTDSCLTLCILLLCLLLTYGKIVPACFVFAAGLLLKPQMLIFTPLLLYGIYEYGVSSSNVRSLLRMLLGSFAAFACFFLAILPFGIEKVLPQYTETLTSYPYASVNAYNIWALFGKNWFPQETHFLNTGITYAQLGTFAIVLLTILSAVIFELLRRRKRAERYFLTGSFIIITMFMFSVRMHERYLYPAMLLLLMTCLYCRQHNFIPAYVFISFGHLLNVWYVLYHYDAGTYYSTQYQTVIALSGVMLLCVMYYYYSLLRSLSDIVLINRTHSAADIKNDIKPSTAQTIHKEENPKCNCDTQDISVLSVYNMCVMHHSDEHDTQNQAKTSYDTPVTKIDILLICAISCIYAIVAFTNLGYDIAPQTEYYWQSGESLSLEFAPDQSPIELYCYLRTETEITVSLQQSADSQDTSEQLSTADLHDASTLPSASDQQNLTAEQHLVLENVFTWNRISLSESLSYLQLTNQSEDAALGELLFLNADGDIVTPLNAGDYPELFDEADTLPETFDYMSSAYFDEIYYFRTANEFLTGQPAYENTHPPLGKILIALGALIFGTNPFGFRFMGTLFGVLMLPFLYLLARNITGNRFITVITTLCFAFDFMHYTQTRLATIDVFVVFFIIVMYYFMERYLRLSFYDTPLRKTLRPLGACGLAFGLGISCKWSGFYAGAGLAVLFFVSLYSRYKEYRFACANPSESTNGISHSCIIKNFVPNTIKTIGFCVVFFIIIPLSIYILSYIPFRDYSQDGLLTRMWNNQLSMYHYHSTLEATHPYSSVWYEWPTMLRPVFYFSKQLGDGMYQGISAFGNPLVWYTAIPAAGYTFYSALFKRNRTAGFLSIGFLAQFLPWMFVSRCTFLYHYFPSVPFLVLMIGFVMTQMHKKIRPQIFYPLCVVYCVAVIVMFVMFYPVITGTPVSGEFVSTYLRWMDSWVLILQ